MGTTPAPPTHHLFHDAVDALRFAREPKLLQKPPKARVEGQPFEVKERHVGAQDVAHERVLVRRPFANVLPDLMKRREKQRGNKKAFF
jgi:hypothetical protein